MPRGGGGVCIIAPPPLYWRGMGLRRLDRHGLDRHGAQPTNEASPRLRRPPLRVPSRTAARLDQQVRPPPLPCLAPSRSPAHRSAVLPTCSGDADLEQPRASGPSGVRPKAAACTAGCAAARAARAAAADAERRAAGGWVVYFFSCPYSVSHPLFAPFVSAGAVAAAAAAGPALP